MNCCVGSLIFICIRCTEQTWSTVTDLLATKNIASMVAGSDDRISEARSESIVQEKVKVQRQRTNAENTGNTTIFDQNVSIYRTNRPARVRSAGNDQGGSTRWMVSYWPTVRGAHRWELVVERTDSTFDIQIKVFYHRLRQANFGGMVTMEGKLSSPCY